MKVGCVGGGFRGVKLWPVTRSMIYRKVWATLAKTAGYGVYLHIHESLHRSALILVKICVCCPKIKPSNIKTPALYHFPLHLICCFL